MEVNRKAPVLAELEIEIAAPPERVWQRLTDLRCWPEWNPDITEVSLYGAFETGSDFRWKASGVTILSQLRAIVPLERLLWTGRSPGVKATHLWQLSGRDGNTVVYSAESFEGLLPRLLKGPFTRMLNTSLERWLESLKQACES